MEEWINEKPKSPGAIDKLFAKVKREESLKVTKG